MATVMWDVHRREMKAGPLRGHEDPVWTVESSPSKNSIVSVSKFISFVAYFYDGSCIVSGSDNRIILVWVTKSGQGTCAPIVGCESDDETVRVWTLDKNFSVIIWNLRQDNLVIDEARGENSWYEYLPNFTEIFAIVGLSIYWVVLSTSNFTLIRNEKLHIVGIVSLFSA